MPDKKETDTIQITGNAQQTYEVTVEGSLGLLALGAVGIKAWRKKRDESINRPELKKENE
jgi:hypothetical protein